MTRREVVGRVVDLGLKPLGKRCGFRKSGLNFYRRLGEVVQVIHVEDHTKFGSTFLVCVALAFDGLWRDKGLPIPERPKPYLCHFGAHMDHLAPEAGLPRVWNLPTPDGCEEMGRLLARGAELVVAEMDRIDSAAAFLRHPWLGGGKAHLLDALLAARLHLSLGDRRAALEILRVVGPRAFGIFPTVAEALENYGLAALADEYTLLACRGASS
jgi:hypothetical protein